MIRVCVVGALMMDIAASAPRRPVPGETVRGDAVEIRPGGKGFNQAVAVARLGGDAALFGCIGDDDFGAAFRHSLRVAGVRDRVITRADERTGVGLPVVTPDGGNSIVIVPLANDSLTAAEIARHDAEVGSADVLLLQHETPAQANLAAATAAAANGVLVVVNPAPADCPQWDVLRLADVVVPNEVEAVELTGAASTSEAAHVLAATLDCPVVVTLGVGGALVVDGLREVRLPAPRVAAVDSVGAGDVFCAALSVQLAAGVDLERAAEWAVLAASLSVLGPGLTAIPSPEDVTTRLNASRNSRTPGGAPTAPTGPLK